jgi:tetratricopeptide (TPR) repeat protein
LNAYLTEGRAWLERTLENSDGASAALRAKALNGAGFLAQMQGDSVQTEALCSQALAIWRQLKDEGGIARSLNTLAVSALYLRSDFAAARPLYEESLDFYRRAGQKDGMANALTGLGAIAHHQGDGALARSLHSESLALRREIGSQGGVAISLSYLGQIAYRQEDYPTAQALYAESIALAGEEGNMGLIPTFLERYAILLAKQRQEEQAARLWGAAESLREENGDPMLPVNRPDFEQCVAEARAALGEKTFAAAWAEGRAMTWKQAIEYALEGIELPDEKS